MTEHDRTHPQWVIPQAPTGPASGAAAPALIRPDSPTATQEPSTEPSTAPPAAPETHLEAAGRSRRWHRADRRPAARGSGGPRPAGSRRRALIAAAIGLGLVAGGGAAGTALAAEGGPDGRGAVVTDGGFRDRGDGPGPDN